jgi:uncharacterized coiled-coil protein SlyX
MKKSRTKTCTPNADKTLEVRVDAGEAVEDGIEIRLAKISKQIKEQAEQLRVLRRKIKSLQSRKRIRL